MLPVLTRDEARALDRDAVDRLGLQGLVLMENAGRGAFEALVGAFPERLARVVVVGGPGQNGGDAWVVARLLAVAGHRPCCVLIGDAGPVRGDAAPNLAAVERLGLTLHRLPDDDLAPLERALAHATLVVDGLFGTGLARPIEGRYARAVEALNAAGVPVFALDLPSGVDADTGQVLGVAVKAAATATFGGLKRGLTQHPGRALAGAVTVAHIGVPGPAPGPCFVLEARDVASWVTPRPEDAHKGGAGHVLLFTGAPGTVGAALLCGRAALRGGAGLATVAAGPALIAALEGRVPELMTAELPATSSAAALAPLYERRDALVVGPGLGMSRAARALSLAASLASPLPAALDADALNALAEHGVEALQEVSAPRVLTPHPKEAARLLASSVAAVQADRFGAALELSRRSGQVVVLKGASTVVAEPGGRLAVCTRGTPALGVGGTGDVLAGAVGALLASGLSAFEAAASAVFVHALAGELAATSDRGLFASEVADALPRALTEIRRAG